MDHIKANNLEPVMLELGQGRPGGYQKISLDDFLKGDSPVKISLQLVR